MKIKTKNIVLVSMFAALTAVGAFIKIPIPYIPITMQFLFCAFAGVLLGSKLGALSQLVYVLLGLLGLPIFTKGGGLMYIFEPTFGYLIGFIVCAYVIGYLTERIKNLNFMKTLASILAGVFFLYSLGLIHFYIIMNFYVGKATSFGFVFYWGFLLCIGGDIFTSVVVALISNKILPRLKFRHS